MLDTDIYGVAQKVFCRLRRQNFILRGCVKRFFLALRAKLNFDRDIFFLILRSKIRKKMSLSKEYGVV
jgi:hypothetical protein